MKMYSTLCHVKFILTNGVWIKGNLPLCVMLDIAVMTVINTNMHNFPSDDPNEIFFSFANFLS